jgi:uncharacterized protein (DUF1800 family)
VPRCWLVSVRRIGEAAVASACLLTVIGCGGNSSPAAQPQITVTGGGQVRLGATAQLTATVTNSTSTAVNWQVNGVAGGSTSVGTISSTGLYTPPATIPSPNTVTITAVSQTLTGVSGAATEAILNPVPMVSSATATETAAGATTYTVDVVGTGFVSTSTMTVAGANVPVTFVSGTELKSSGMVTIATGTTSVAVVVTNPDPGTMNVSSNAQVMNYKATVQAAARLLDQATFGPTLTDINHVGLVGIDAYLTEQFNTQATLLPDIAATPPTVCVNSLLPCEQSEWWQTVVTAPDQLRQRVAFALSEIFVVSTNSINARAVTTYQNTLAKDAFANFYTIMQDVTLSPAMGLYLNMLNSAKPAVVGGVSQIANENYAREEMQLFSTGIFMLNQDGTQQLDGSGNPIPVYTEAQVQAFARAYTGWTFANASGTGAATKFLQAANYTAPMTYYDPQHDMNAKVLLNGTTLPAGQSTTQDLQGALTNLFNHQNVGPFICRQLIQHLVTSSPSPAYVARISAVFANDGTGTRGNMQAVIKAILTDTEARAGDTNPSFDGGHLREPMLYLTNVIRALGFTNNDAVAGNDVVANASYNSLGNYTTTLGEKPYSSGSVFNFFPPNYVIPETTLNAPEFGQENTASAVLRLSLANSIVYNGISGFKVDLSKTSALGMTASATGNAPTDSGNLVDSLAIMFMHGQMPAQMRTAIVNHIATLTDPAERVRVATYLVITSSFYKIEH